ncbi:hypothetical protein CHS0354_011407 [Potamilus streckersoni]|uniref:Glycosyltransferase 2-like domain-containing protein n=1 Tax=Potamilus streckersoni TaxID=2493646 RepID=A0AAE0TGB6_9BIVA|nr:hypothetical protein CHS0354_011407 [Potamilus streckersoni]
MRSQSRTRMEKLKHCISITVMVVVMISAAMFNIYYDNDVKNADKEYDTVTARVFYFIILTPFVSFPMVLGNFLGLLWFNPFEEIRRPIVNTATLPRICFRMVTRGIYKDLVLSNLQRNREICVQSELFNCIFEVVSDVYIPGIEDYCRQIVLPNTYNTKRGTLFKARALNFCLEPGVSMVQDNEWIVHLDEETTLSEASIYEGKADIGQGTICYGNGEVVNWLTTLSDSIRVAIDYGLFRFQLAVFHCPFFGFKGSYVVLKQGVEKEVGLDLGPHGSIAEDIYFALLAWNRGFKFDFVLGEMHEKSPFTCMDFIRQRRRWFVGQMFTVLSKEIPISCKIGLLISLACNILMPLSTSIIFIKLYYPFSRPVITNILMGFIVGVIAFMYLFGSAKSIGPRSWNFFKYIAVYCFTLTVVIPVAACMESFATIWGLFSLNSTQFYVIKKDTVEFTKTRSSVLKKKWYE